MVYEICLREKRYDAAMTNTTQKNYNDNAKGPKSMSTFSFRYILHRKSTFFKDLESTYFNIGMILQPRISEI